MDAFYASVEQRDNPELMGKPVVVGADPKSGRGRGVVSAASYEARKFGIHSALSISQAYLRCPKAIFLPVRGERYVEVSKNIMAILSYYTPLVEPISLDEAFLDMTGTERLKGDVRDVGKKIKLEIKKKEKLTASIGIGPNKLIAKIASDIDKPDGFVVVEEDCVNEFLNPLPVRRLYGIGKKTEERLSMMGIKKISELADISEKKLNEIFGNMGNVIWNYAKGVDISPVLPYKEVKSISNEITFEKDCFDQSNHIDVILKLSEKVGYRLRKKKLYGKTVFLKIRLSDYSTYVRNITTPEMISLGEDIFNNAFSLYSSIDFRKQPVRLVGVGVTKLFNMKSVQTDLFKSEKLKRERVTRAMDRLRGKYGEKIIGRGGLSLNR
jgi:nucleotidyltransferase/DNA polymerase involved in DNA repair